MTTRLTPSARQVHPPTAAELMAVPVVTVGADAAVAEVWRLMQSAHLGHVAVVDDANQCLGILDVHDLWVSWAFDLEAGHPRTVLHLVTATPAVTPDTPLSQLCVALLGSRCGAVVVLNDKGALRGVVTATDVLRAVAEHEEDRPC